VLCQVRDRVAGVRDGVFVNCAGKVYDTNYLHKKKLLPGGQEGNSIGLTLLMTFSLRGII
jgi:hypothetical protein